MAKRTARARRRRQVTFEDVAAAFCHPERQFVSGYDLDRLRHFFHRHPITAVDPESARAYALKREQQGEPFRRSTARSSRRDYRSLGNKETTA